MQRHRRSVPVGIAVIAKTCLSVKSSILMSCWVRFEVASFSWPGERWDETMVGPKRPCKMVSAMVRETVEGGLLCVTSLSTGFHPCTPLISRK